MREHRMFIRERWHRLMVRLADLLLQEEVEGKLGQNELNYFLYCLKNLKQGQAPGILEILAEHGEKFFSLTAAEKKAIREIITGIDWTDPEEIQGVETAVKTILED
ncbi:MAG: hypothetical protein H0Z35_11660 [Thermoanaerobacteraceae bacterium]|nr:hypothetical protein [Thermoanaerobacteraceae bacterium]